jgi:uroporphyrinogen decarboxylase
MADYRLQRREAPDFSRLRRVLTRQGGRDYVPFFEMILNPAHFEAFTGLTPPPGMNFMPTSPTFEATFAYYLQCCAQMGFDHGTINLCGFGGFPARRHGVEGTARSFVMEEDATIACEADFDAYPWPSARTLDVEAMARTARLAPEGMGVFTGGGAIFQTMCDLLGYTGIALMRYEQPELLQRVADRVGGIMLELFELAASLPFIDGLLVTGDLGFKTGTFLAPDDLRRLIFPWHARICQAVHRHGKLCILHSCGNLAEVMPDIIACGYDGKHSFEDAITPSMFDLHRQYGDRICLIGGIDVDLLCRADEATLRHRVCETIDTMAPGGGYLLGSGNSLADYVPLASAWAMFDEGLKYGR